jgi:amino acid transporter
MERAFGPLGRTALGLFVAIAALTSINATMIVGALQHDGFEAMVEFTAPVFWGFLMLVGVALLVLRHRDPTAPRSFRVPLYPFTPLVFIAVCAFLLYSSITYALSRNAIHVSLLVMLVGVAAWAITRMRTPKR